MVEVTGVEEQETFLRVIEVRDAPKVSALAGHFAPDRVAVRWVDGQLSTVTVAGPKILANGKISAHNRHKYTYPYNHVPEWVRPFLSRDWIPEPVEVSAAEILAS